MYRLIIGLIALLAIQTTYAKSNVEKETFVYAVRDNADSLRLDRYHAPNAAAPQPVVIFAFGGSFAHGERDNAEYLPFFNTLAENGFTVVSIDYRKGMANYNPTTGIDGFAGQLGNAINMAVEDFLTATSYVLANAANWGINPMAITASGSSAGAITALQSEYLLANRVTTVASVFPEGFNYAGVVSFSGAIISQSAPTWTAKPCPMMLIHGDADSTVPFKSIGIPGIAGLYGSEYIANQLTTMGQPHELYVIKGAAHEVATNAMKENIWDVIAFLNNFVLGNENRISVVGQSTPGASTDYNTDFTLQDFIISNMPH